MNKQELLEFITINLKKRGFQGEQLQIMRKKVVKRLVESLKTEESSTSSADGYSTPNAFAPSKKAYRKRMKKIVKPGNGYDKVVRYGDDKNGKGYIPLSEYKKPKLSDLLLTEEEKIEKPIRRVDISIPKSTPKKIIDPEQSKSVREELRAKYIGEWNPVTLEEIAQNQSKKFDQEFLNEIVPEPIIKSKEILQEQIQQTGIINPKKIKYLDMIANAQVIPTADPLGLGGKKNNEFEEISADPYSSARTD